MTESIDQTGCEFINQLKERAKQHYGLSYEIINLVNGTAQSVTTHNSINGNATPLSLTLNSTFGINTLIRSDFNHNIKVCSLGTKNAEFISNVKYLWHWFECNNRLTRIILNFLFYCFYFSN